MRAIDCYNAALTVYTREDFPQKWARTQNNLGTAYWNISDGDKGANLRSAIDCYNAALTVYTKEAFPQKWAMTQNNLGTAYANIPDGDKGANVRAAIDCFKAALTVHTKVAFPQDCAATHLNLGLTYEFFIEIEDQKQHLQQAESHLVNAESGYATAGMTLDLPTVRDALARVRAKLAQLETESGSES